MSGMFSVSGLASGLDTDSMIRSLMQIERMPIARMESRQAALRKVDDAWADITKRLSAVRDAVNTLRDGSRLTDRWTASSSNETVVTASVTGSPTAGSTTFTVDRLATAKSAASNTAGAFTSADDLVAAGTFTLQDASGNQLVSVTTDGTTSLADLAAKLDAASGVKASVVRVDTGDHRLVLGSETTGTEGNFRISSDIAGLVNDPNDATTSDFDVTAGQNAKLTVGNLTVYRSSNTVTDLVDGVTLNLQDTGTTTVSLAHDVESAAKDITKLVDQVNAALNRLTDLSKYDAETRRSGPLTGDGTARRLVNELRRGLADTLSTLSGSFPTAGSIGISMTREGTFEVDQEKLTAALEADPAAVDRLVNRGITSTATGVSLQKATTTTRTGTYDVAISQIAKVARATGAAYTQPVTDPEIFTITAADGTAVQVTIGSSDDVTTAIGKINQALRDAEVDTITAEENTSGGIDLVESRYGSGTSFTVTADDLGGDGVNSSGLAVGTFTGQDVTGTITSREGQTITATGAGTRLAVATDADHPAAGLALLVEPDAGTNFSITVTQGLVGRMDQVLTAFEGASGAIARAQEGLESRIDMFQDRIDAFEVRLEQKERVLIRQFTGMESALAQLQSQGQWLAGQLGGLSANAPQG